MTARTNSEENSSDSSNPAPSAMSTDPNNSLFLHIKTAPCQFYAQEAASILYLSFTCQGLISFAAS